MMEKYFYIKNENKFGPVDIEELKKSSIQQDTLIWIQGLKDWTKASSIPELNELFIHLPPPIPNKQTKKYQRSLQFLAVICILSSLISWVDSRVESKIICGILATGLSLFAFKNSKGESMNQRIYSLVPIFTIALSILLLLVSNTSMRSSNELLVKTITIGTILFIVLTFNKIRKL